MATKAKEEKTVLEQEVEHLEAQVKSDEQAAVDPMKIMQTVQLPRATGKQENFVMVGLNGKNYQIQRGVAVKVPQPVAAILEESMRADDRAAAYIDSLHQ